MTESDLISGCIKGNRQAQAAFYHAYAGLVMGVVRRYSRNEQEAEDVFQEAFVKIYQNLKSVSQPQALPGWIKRVAVNTAINSFKKHSKHHGHADVDTASATAVELSESALERLGNEELLAAIQQLAPGYQMVFNLYAIEGYNHKEIGELLGISEGTSKSQYARAKAQLQDILAKLGIFTSSN